MVAMGLPKIRWSFFSHHCPYGLDAEYIDHNVGVDMAKENLAKTVLTIRELLGAKFGFENGEPEREFSSARVYSPSY